MASEGNGTQHKDIHFRRSPNLMTTFRSCGKTINHLCYGSTKRENRRSSHKKEKHEIGLPFHMLSATKAFWSHFIFIVLYFMANENKMRQAKKRDHRMYFVAGYFRFIMSMGRKSNVKIPATQKQASKNRCVRMQQVAAWKLFVFHLGFCFSIMCFCIVFIHASRTLFNTLAIMGSVTLYLILNCSLIESEPPSATSCTWDFIARALQCPPHSMKCTLRCAILHFIFNRFVHFRLLQLTQLNWPSKSDPALFFNDPNQLLMSCGFSYTDGFT